MKKICNASEEEDWMFGRTTGYLLGCVETCSVHKSRLSSALILLGISTLYLGSFSIRYNGYFIDRTGMIIFTVILGGFTIEALVAWSRNEDKIDRLNRALRDLEAKYQDVERGRKRSDKIPQN